MASIVRVDLTLGILRILQVMMSFNFSWLSASILMSVS
jgi:hypothetical protein